MPCPNIVEFVKDILEIANHTKKSERRRIRARAANDFTIGPILPPIGHRASRIHEPYCRSEGI